MRRNDPRARIARLMTRWRRDRPALLWDYKRAATLDAIARIGFTPTFSRGSKVWASVNGVLTEFAADEPVLTENGYLHEPQRTNKCQHFNASPTDLTGVGGDTSIASIVSDSSALDAAGLNIGNGNVVDLDNTGGGSSAFVSIAGATGNTNDHTSSAYVRLLAGTPGNYIGLGDTAYDAPVSLTSDYQRVRVTQTPASTSSNLAFRVAAGAHLRVHLSQLEEGTTATSPIVVAGAAATRNEPSQTTGVNGTGEPDVSGGCTIVVRDSVKSAGTPPWMIRLEDDASNVPVNLIGLKVAGGGGSDLTVVTNNTVRTNTGEIISSDGNPHTRVLRISAFGATVWEDGSQVYTDTTDYSTVLANVTDFRVGYQVQGEYEFARLYTSLLSDSECQRLSNLV